MSQTRGLWATEKVLDGRKTLDRYLALAATVPIYILRYPKRLDLLPRLADIVRQIAAPVPSPRPRVAASQPRACAGATSDRPRLARYFGFSRTDHKSRATEAEMNPINILRWAAGADIGLPRFDGVSDKRLLNLLGIDSDALVDTVVLHRLTGRFLARAASERPAWCSPALVARLAATMSKVRFDASRRIQALREIAAAFGDDAHPPIAVKGPSVYAITRDDAVVHESEDLDVLAGDTEALEATLQALGYRGERRNGYHFAAMRSRCSTIGVEIHRAFPFVSYPYDLAAEACAPGREPRIVDQSCGDFQESALSYPDILKCSLRPTTGLATGIAVADASMSALILCAHAFRHYIESGARRIPVVRLGELADIASLAAHPQFDPKTFAALATAYGAADSISFIGSLLKGCYGRDLLSETLQTRSRRSSDIFPRMLTRRGGWASGLTFEEVLRPLDSRAGFYRQHPNPIVATTSSEARAYGLFAHTDRGPDRPEPIRSALVHSTEREHLPIRFSARKEADGLVLAISIGRPLRRRHRYEVVAQIAYSDNEEFADLAAPEENIRRRIGIDASGDVWREGEDQTAASSMHLGPNGCEARLFMPWTMFRAAFPAMVQLPLMLSILHARELADTKPRMLGKRGFSPPTAVFVPLMVDLGGRTSGAQRCAY